MHTPDFFSGPREQHEPECLTVRWVDLVALDGPHRAARFVARCVLVNGIVRCHGDATVVAALEDGVQTYPETARVRPRDGEQFLRALPRAFRSAYLLATDVQEGPEAPVGKNNGEVSVHDA